jgi:hypothetical protein
MPLHTPLNLCPPLRWASFRDNSRLTDLVTGLTYLPIGFISAPSTFRDHSCVLEAQVVAGLWTFSLVSLPTILMWAVFSKFAVYVLLAYLCCCLFSDFSNIARCVCARARARVRFSHLLLCGSHMPPHRAFGVSCKDCARKFPYG